MHPESSSTDVKLSSYKRSCALWFTRITYTCCIIILMKKRPKTPKNLEFPWFLIELAIWSIDLCYENGFKCQEQSVQVFNFQDKKNSRNQNWLTENVCLLSILLLQFDWPRIWELRMTLCVVTATQRVRGAAQLLSNELDFSCLSFKNFQELSISIFNLSWKFFLVVMAWSISVQPYNTIYHYQPYGCGSMNGIKQYWRSSIISCFILEYSYECLDFGRASCIFLA